jgi:YVTN family beta-propeller protein
LNRRRSTATLVAAGLTLLGSAALSGVALASPASSADSCSSAQLASQTYAVTSSKSDSWVYVLDSTPQLHVVKVVDGSSLGLETPGAAVLGNGGKDLWVDDWGTSDLVEIDTCTMQEVSSIDMGSENVASFIPAGGSSDGRYMYVAVPLSGIKVLDTTDNTVVGTYSVSTLIGKVTISPDGTRLYAPTLTGVEVLNAATGQQIGSTISVSGLPTWSAVSPDGKTLYTANTLGDSLSVINLTTATVTKTTSLSSGSTPVVVNVSPDGSQVYLGDGASSDGVAVFSPDGTLIKTVATSGAGVGVNPSADGKYFYAEDMGAGCTFLNNGLFTYVVALFGGCSNPGEITPYSTSSFAQAGSAIQVNGFPVGVYSLEPGVPN